MFTRPGNPCGAVPLMAPFLHHDTPTWSNDLRKMGGVPNLGNPRGCVYSVYIPSGNDCYIVIEHGPVEIDRNSGFTQLEHGGSFHRFFACLPGRVTDVTFIPAISRDRSQKIVQTR